MKLPQSSTCPVCGVHKQKKGANHTRCSRILQKRYRDVNQRKETTMAICQQCSGSGEGLYEGSVCYACKGSGELSDPDGMEDNWKADKADMENDERRVS